MDSEEVKDFVHPLKPVPPDSSQCCGTGCSPCVYDLYEIDLKKWQNQIHFTEPNEAESYSFSQTTYKLYELVEITHCSPTSAIYAFSSPCKTPITVLPGHHLLVKSTSEENFILRQYSPIKLMDSDYKFDLLIKRYPEGQMSQVISKWEIGHLVPMKGLFGSWKYSPNTHKNLLLIVAGTGIAPVYEIIKKVLQNEEDETKVQLLYSSKKFSEILLRLNLLEFTSYWNFQMIHYLSEESNPALKKYHEVVNLRKLEKHDVTTFVCKNPSVLAVVCGSKSFEKDFLNALREGSVPDENVIRF